MKTLIAFLLIWIGTETNYNVDLPHPEIRLLSQVELERVYYGDNKNPTGQLHALYDP